MTFMGWVKRLFAGSAEVEETLIEIKNFQRVATADLKEQIHRVEKRLDFVDTVLKSIEEFQRSISEDLKRQILAVELRLDETNSLLRMLPSSDNFGLFDLRNEFANLKQCIDRQALGILRLVNQVEIR